MYVLTDYICEMSRYGSTYETVDGHITLNPNGSNSRVRSTKTLIVSESELKTAHNDGEPGWYIGIDGTAHATHATAGAVIAFHYAGSELNTSTIREVNRNVVSINGFEYATNKVLWYGAWYMAAAHTADLTEAISKQPHGIVLVFSRYSGGSSQNYHFQTFFVPKQQISNHAGCGHTFLLSTDGNFGLFAAKYLYINDSTIVGNDVNTAAGTGACGITYDNKGFVLRYVIGV